MATRNKDDVSFTVLHFDKLPGSARVSMHDLSVLSNRSKVTLFRDIKKGRLPVAKNGNSTTTSVADARDYLRGAK